MFNNLINKKLTAEIQIGKKSIRNGKRIMQMTWVKIKLHKIVQGANILINMKTSWFLIYF